MPAAGEPVHLLHPRRSCLDRLGEKEKARSYREMEVRILERQLRDGS
jgi:hypothetical protein